VAEWILAGVALLLALVALGTARRLSRKLDALNQSYWELRYDYTRLRSQVARLDPEQADSTQPDPQPQPATVSFVPLSAIRKKDQ
jgi:hypothetical protein